jgi:DNA-binding MarR family transcriptional regulator
MIESTKIANLLERLGNLMRANERSLGLEYGLQPVHVQVLSYLLLCNRHSNTPVSVAGFLGVTKGTVSQSVNVLEHKGLITKSPDAEDGRVVYLSVTEAGRRFIESEFPQQDMLTILDGMHYGDRKKLAELLTDLLIGLQHRNGGRMFAECPTCRHFRKDTFGDVYCTPFVKKDLSWIIVFVHSQPNLSIISGFMSKSLESLTVPIGLGCT